MEGEERNAQRQRNRRKRDRRERECRRDRVDVGEREVGILEHGERAEICSDRKRQPALACPRIIGTRKCQAEAPIAEHRREDQRDVGPLAPEVEKCARQQQDRVLCAPRSEQVRRQSQRQEQVQENRGRENHSTANLFANHGAVSVPSR